jgi:hypothetical protein
MLKVPSPVAGVWPLSTESVQVQEMTGATAGMPNAILALLAVTGAFAGL